MKIFEREVGEVILFRKLKPKDHSWLLSLIFFEFFVKGQRMDVYFKIMLKIAWKFLKKWIFFDFSKWILIIIYHSSSDSKCPSDLRELFSSHIDTPGNFRLKKFLTSKWPIWSCFWLKSFKITWKLLFMMGFPESKCQY